MFRLGNGAVSLEGRATYVTPYVRSSGLQRYMPSACRPAVVRGVLIPSSRNRSAAAYRVIPYWYSVNTYTILYEGQWVPGQV